MVLFYIAVQLDNIKLKLPNEMIKILIFYAYILGQDATLLHAVDYDKISYCIREKFTGISHQWKKLF